MKLLSGFGQPSAAGEGSRLLARLFSNVFRENSNQPHSGLSFEFFVHNFLNGLAKLLKLSVPIDRRSRPSAALISSNATLLISHSTIVAP